uniref:Cytochrome bc1 complex cytochrome b/c subunit n=1 Tax=uncultured marine group II/III euryarchaeote AD1000_59_C09 TaxID=1457791 RepID=A0A075G074_9EURY|nr:cytochrome bc1 complex cytochrome b/c subunit [uncultured marine group II/III euryarchaeote AD1000_59_C09]
MSEQDAIELIGDYQDEQIDLDTVSKLEHREDHSVLEAELVKGEPLYPHELTRDGVLSLYIMALFFYLSAFVPPPLHGAADPTAGTAFPPPLPDWYLLWAFGCLKVAWDIEFTIFGYHFFLMTAKVWGTLVQGMIVGLVVAVPFIDRAIGVLIDPQYGDVVNRGHERRPIEDPVRAAIGVYGIAMVIMLSIFSINANIAIYYPEINTKVLSMVTLFGPLGCALITYLFLDRRRSEGAKPLSDEERFDLYVDGIKDRRMQRIYEFKLNRCYQCGLCDDICPVRDMEGEYELNIIYNTFQNEHDGVAMWSCITCGMCTAVCPQNIEYVDYVLEQRALTTSGASS